MIKFFKTSHMEDSIIKLDQEYDRVMVRVLRDALKPIRLKVNLIQQIRPFYARNDPAFDAEIEKWKVENGTLLNYRSHFKKEAVLPHDGCFISECPISMEIIKSLTRDTEKVAVIYTPPTWRTHEELMYSRYPTGVSCKQFIQYLNHIPPLKENVEIAQLLGIPTAGTVAVLDSYLQDLMPGMATIRKRSMRSVQGRQFILVAQLIPRIEPEDKVHMQLYKAIQELPAIGNVRYAQDNVLSHSMRFWKLGLRALIRSGCVQSKGTLGFYFLGGIKPDYEKIHKEHELAKLQLAQLMVDFEKFEEFS